MHREELPLLTATRESLHTARKTQRNQKLITYLNLKREKIFNGSTLTYLFVDSIETYILPYVKQITSPGSMHETGHSKLVHWDNPEEWVGEGGGGEGPGRGTHVQPWLIHVSVWQKPLQYCKAINLQLK